ncbi:MAG TPA: hypothetical protein VEQ12_01395 [Candidatus Limnocylindria bacterium]|nr:hypothetical protein [Candidatus Limnocylindria bacterium]
MPANLALTQLDRTGRIHVLVDQLVAATNLADDPRASSQSPSYSRRAWLAARDQAIDRFVQQVLQEFPPPPNAGPEIEVQLRTLATDLARHRVSR